MLMKDRLYPACKYITIELVKNNGSSRWFVCIYE